MLYKRLKTACLILILAALTLLPLAPVSASGSYAYYIPVTIDAAQVSATLTDFPVLISSTISELATTANGGHVENTDATGGASGSLEVPADFIVSGSDECSSSLDFEIEQYDKTTGQIILHVEVPSLDGSSDTTIYFCYGDAAVTTSQENISGTWSNGFEAVLHFAVNDGQAYDSTGNNNHAADYVSGPNYNGKIGYGQALDGTDDYYQLPSVSSLEFDNTESLNISAWVYSNGNAGLFNYGDRSSTAGLSFYLRSTGAQVLIDDGSDQVSTGDAYDYTAASWTLVSFGLDRSTGQTALQYNDNSPSTADASAVDGLVASSYKNLDIGRRIYNSSAGDYYSGNIDEVRVSSVARSSDWITTSYNNQSSPGSFYTVGSESPTEDPPAMADPSVVVPDGLSSAVLSAILADNPEPTAELWAITDINTVGDYSMISLAGLDVADPDDTATWDVYDAIWAGSALARDNLDGSFTVGLQGSATYSTLLGESSFADPTTGDIGGGSGGNWIWFPWKIGRQANYGALGVHPASSRIFPGWDAVDFVGGTTYGDNSFPNLIYGAKTEPIEWICRDGTQVGLKTANFYYLHLEENSSLQVGSMIYQGQPIGSLVMGSFDDNCGHAVQQPTSYHLHFGFYTSGNYFQIEHWVLNLTTGIWSNGDNTVGIRENLLAEWPDHVGPVPTEGPTPTPGGPTPTVGPEPPPPPSYGGDSLWDPVVYGLHELAEVTAERFPEHEASGFGSQITSGAEIAIRVAFVMLSSNFDLTISLIVFGLLAASEAVRVIYAIYLGIKKLIPMIG